MNKKLYKTDQEELIAFEKQKKKTRSYFWFFLFTYTALFLFLWVDSIDSFGFFYILSITLFVSFFLAWASSLFVLLLNIK